MVSSANQLVSVIIPTYNRSEYLISAMDSVIEQHYRPIELIVVDDGSEDDTEEAVELWCSRHLPESDFDFKFKKKNNSGAPAARNLGFNLCSGEYIQFLDSDDILHPEKISSQVEVFLKDEKLDYVYSSAVGFKKYIGDSSLSIGGPESMEIDAHIGAHSLNTELGLYRRKILEAMGPWNESLKVWQDGEFNLRLFTNGADIRFFPKVLTYCRFHDGQRISSGIGNKNTIYSLKVMVGVLMTGGLSASAQKRALRAASKKFVSIAKHAINEGDIFVAKEASSLAIYNGLRSGYIVHYFKCLLFGALVNFMPKKFLPRFLRRARVL